MLFEGFKLLGDLEGNTPIVENKQTDSIFGNDNETVIDENAGDGIPVLTEEESKNLFKEEKFGEDAVVIEEEIPTEETKEEAGEPEEESDVYEDLINTLSDEKGILWYDPNKDYDQYKGEELFEVVLGDTVTKRVEDYKNGLGEKSLKLIEHLESGGGFDSFVEINTQVDYSRVDTEDVNTQKALIEDHLLKIGYDEEEVSERLQELEDLGKLEREAKTAQKFLSKIQKEENDKIVEAERIQKQATLKEQEDLFNDLRKNVESTKEIADIKLSDKQHKSLVDALFTPTKKGDDKAEKAKQVYYALAKIDKQTALNAAFFIHSDFKFKEIEKKANTQLAKNLKKELNHYQDKNLTSKGGDPIKNKDTDFKMPSKGYFN